MFASNRRVKWQNLETILNYLATFGAGSGKSFVKLQSENWMKRLWLRSLQFNQQRQKRILGSFLSLDYLTMKGLLLNLLIVGGKMGKVQR